MRNAKESPSSWNKRTLDNNFYPHEEIKCTNREIIKYLDINGKKNPNLWNAIRPSLKGQLTAINAYT